MGDTIALRLAQRTTAILKARMADAASHGRSTGRLGDTNAEHTMQHVASVLHGGNCTRWKIIEMLGFYRNARNGRGPLNSPRGTGPDLAKVTEK